MVISIVRQQLRRTHRRRHVGGCVCEGKVFFGEQDGFRTIRFSANRMLYGMEGHRWHSALPGLPRIHVNNGYGQVEVQHMAAQSQKKKGASCWDC
eukprot:6472139-Amphidinium_carterae.3